MNADTYDDWARWAAITSHDREVDGGLHESTAFDQLSAAERRFDWLATVERQLERMRDDRLPSGFNNECAAPDTWEEKRDA